MAPSSKVSAVTASLSPLRAVRSRVPIAYDGEEIVRAPYDGCVLVMPVPNNVKAGLTAVRLGRVERR